MSIFKENKSGKEVNEEKIIEKYNEERIQQIVKRYEEDMERNKKMIRPFADIITEIVGNDTVREFQNKTELGKDMFYNLKKRVNTEHPCMKNTIVSVCAGYDVGLGIAMELLRSQGSSFNLHSKRDCAYITILTEYRGTAIKECNELLAQLKVKEGERLGQCARRPRKTKSDA